MATTITEALAELKTLDKRIVKKEEFVMQYLVRQDMYKDPLEKEGGSVTAVGREIQAITDLRERVVAIRRAIANKNAVEKITIGSQERTISDWLTWRREVAPKRQQFLVKIAGRISFLRKDALQKSVNVIAGNATPAQPTDVLVNISETELQKWLENMEEVLGTLDGQLSLKNATLTIEV